MEEKRTEEVVELNPAEAEQVVGGKRFAGHTGPAGHLNETNTNNTGVDTLHGGGLARA